MECPKCEGAMEPGFVGDATYYGGRSVVAPVWYSGRIAWSFWGFLKMWKRRGIYVQTMRCEECGYLESYALEAPAPGQE